MSILKAFLYTILAFIFWTLIQLSILLPVKYFIGTPEDFTHIIGITKIVSVVGAFLLIYYLFWKPNFDFRKALKITNYSSNIYLYLPLLGIGLWLVYRPFWDFSKILDYYQGVSFLHTPIISNNHTALIYSLISTLLISPIIEELFFRRFLLEKLSQRYKPKLSLVISSLCFSIIHIETPNNLIPTFIGGVVLGIIYLKTRKIGYCVMLHFTINLIVLTINNLEYFRDNRKTGYNFDSIYWISFVIGIFITFIGLKKLINANKEKSK
ncbi:MAG: type II CAAX endopeptidase family protein [Gelidibacter sp.]